MLKSSLMTKDLVWSNVFSFPVHIASLWRPHKINYYFCYLFIFEEHGVDRRPDSWGGCLGSGYTGRTPLLEPFIPSGWAEKSEIEWVVMRGIQLQVGGVQCTGVNLWSSCWPQAKMAVRVKRTTVLTQNVSGLLSQNSLDLRINNMHLASSSSIFLRRPQGCHSMFVEWT